MLKFDYYDNWNSALGKECAKSILEANASNNYWLHKIKSNDLTQTLSSIIRTILVSYDLDDCLYGLFKALSNHQPRISPFIATHDYVVKIIHCHLDGTIEFDISPIYHLGPEYIDEYRNKHGKELDEKAVVGLVELSVDELPNPEHKKFRLGIDAGIVFKNSKIPHNKKMLLNLQPTGDGVFAILSCESQMTSKQFAWKNLLPEV